jgi:type VI secretion system protein ImpK
MSMTTRNKRIVHTQDLDALLHGTYLLVVELRHGASVQDSPDLWRRCEKQVEEVQQSLSDAGLSTRSIELISHAQCALLDETVLSVATGEAHAKWASESLQAKFFSRHQAGEFLYEDMRESLRQPSPDVLVLTAFQRVLMLGFQGRYRDVNDPERGQLLDELSARVAPFELEKTLITKSIGQRMHPLRAMHSPLLHILAAGLLLAASWWGLDHWLSGVITTLVPGQG